MAPFYFLVAEGVIILWPSTTIKVNQLECVSIVGSGQSLP